MSLLSYGSFWMDNRVSHRRTSTFGLGGGGEGGRVMTLLPEQIT